MKLKDKTLAVSLLQEKALNDMAYTYPEIASRTGYSKPQLIRIMKEIRQKKDTESIITHGNTGRKPVTTASDQEISYLREFKKPYPYITIAQFRDIYLEDVINAPDKQDDVLHYGLKERSLSWFRELFIKENWRSPAAKKINKDSFRRTHPIRAPRPQRGELVQIDGTPYDWFGDGRVYTLHLAVDDATSEVLAGYFMADECQRGYSRMMKILVEKHGIPQALYSDRHSIFRSVKDRSITQFGRMMQDLNIQMIFANTPQAKGRVERRNQTEQMRLLNDIKRFKIKDYDELNIWYNEFYTKYLNFKFAYLPSNPIDAFRPIAETFDYSSIFRVRLTRVIRNDMFSYETWLYSPVDRNGEIVTIQNGTTVKLYIDAITENMYIEYNMKRYPCIKVGGRMRSESQIVSNQKELEILLKKNRE